MYRPILIFFALVNKLQHMLKVKYRLVIYLLFNLFTSRGFFKTFFLKEHVSSTSTWSQDVASYIRNNDEKILKSCEEVGHKFVRFSFLLLFIVLNDFGLLFSYWVSIRMTFCQHHRSQNFVTCQVGILMWFLGLTYFLLAVVTNSSESMFCFIKIFLTLL